jgi:hypothetical protein
VSEALNQGFEELNEAWKQAEATLKKFHLPDNVWIISHSEWDDPAEPRGQFHYLLGYVWYRGTWRICHDTDYDCHPDEPRDWKPITECSADVRVKAAPQFAKLHEKVVEAAQAYVPVVKSAADELKMTLMTLDL